MSNRFSFISMLMAGTVTPPCRRFIRRSRRRDPIISHRTPGKRAKKNQQESDFHFSSEKKRTAYLITAFIWGAGSARRFFATNHP
jgi:hypothetical protein